MEVIMNVLCCKKTSSSCLQVYLSEEELQRVELYQKVSLRKSTSSAVRALIEQFFRKNMNSFQECRLEGSLDEKRIKVVQCYLPVETSEKLNEFRYENSYASDSECARVIILKSLNSAGIL
jgi:hypothetical protein